MVAMGEACALCTVRGTNAATTRPAARATQSPGCGQSWEVTSAWIERMGWGGAEGGPRGRVGGCGLMGTLWEQTLAELQLVVPRQEFTAWISCLRTAGDADETLTVEAPSAFHRSWVQRHFLERIRTTVTSVAGRPVPVVLAVGAHAAVDTGTGASEDALAPTSPAPIRIRAPKPGEGHREPTFANFVVGA